MGAKRELRELRDFLSSQANQGVMSEFCSSRRIEWKYIPERSPHFGGLWESAVKSTKTHLKRVISAVKLTFEEFTTVLAQVEACLNSRPLIPIGTADDDGREALTPGHFSTLVQICLVATSLASLSVSGSPLLATVVQRLPLEHKHVQ